MSSRRNSWHSDAMALAPHSGHSDAMALAPHSGHSDAMALAPHSGDSDSSIGLPSPGLPLLVADTHSGGSNTHANTEDRLLSRDNHRQSLDRLSPKNVDPSHSGGPYRRSGSGNVRSTNFHSVADLVSSTSCLTREEISEDKHAVTQESYIDVVDENVHSRQTRTPTSACEAQPAVTPEGRVPTPEGSLTEGSPGKMPEGSSDGSPITPREDNQDNRARKGRTIYKAQQVYVLEQVFSRTHYPDPEVIETLARDLDISENKIKVWFQNKRARWRRRAAEAGHGIPGMGLSLGPHALWPHHAASPSGQPLVIPQPMYPGSLHALSPYSLPQHQVLSPYQQALYAGLDPMKTSGVATYSPLSLMHVWSDMAKLNAT